MTLSKTNLPNTFYLIMAITTFTILLQSMTSVNDIAFAQVSNQQPNINAQSLFNTQAMTLGNNVKNLVILIPNEGHHGPNEASEARFLEPSFVPANAVINTGTAVAWYNGDFGHERTVNVKDATGSSVVFSTGAIIDNQASKTYTFNTPGTYSYEAIGDAGYIMKGTITVKNIQSPVTSPAAAGGIDTVGVLMVPTQDLNKYMQDIKNAGLTVDSGHSFNDLRGGQSGTGDVQTLLVWTSGGKDLNTAIAPLSQLSLTLPYS